jgi:hypothetical protein
MGYDGPQIFSAKSNPPPSSLIRRANEQSLRQVEQDFEDLLFSYVKMLREASLDSEAYVGKVLEPMRDAEARRFVSEHYARCYHEQLSDVMGVCSACHRIIDRGGSKLACEPGSLSAQSDRGIGDSELWRRYLAAARRRELHN